MREALAQVADWPEPAQRRRGYVLAGEDWHRGRDRHRRLAARRALRPAGRPARPGRGGLGRLRPLDPRLRPARRARRLLGASDPLGRTPRRGRPLARRREPRRVRATRSPRTPTRVLDDAELAPTLTVDAVVDGRDLTLGLCEELARLAPFGLGNPGVTLLVAGSELSELATVGEGKHLRLAVTANGSRSGAIAFGWGERLDRYRRPGRYDVAFKLDANRWNGTVAPQLVVKRIFETPDALRRAPRSGSRPSGAPARTAWSPEARADLRGARPRRRARRPPQPRRVADLPRRALRAARRRRVAGVRPRGPELH